MKRSSNIILLTAFTGVCLFGIYLIPFSNNSPKAQPIAQSSVKANQTHVRSGSAVSRPTASRSAVSRPAAKSNPPKQSKYETLFKQLQGKYRLLFIPTYDGSNQLTHPKILYFQNGWNGYHYWMSMTPYPHEADIYENPSIVVSNDGIAWSTPKGLVNPVSGLPPDFKTGGHFSDSHIVMRGNTMELWYRYNPAFPNKEKKRRANNAQNIYYRRTSTDGISWSQPQKLLESKDGHLSLCVINENNKYKIWYATYGGELFYNQSSDPTKWGAPVRCTVPLPKGLKPYHQDIIKNGSKYYLLQTAIRAKDYTFQLFLFTSNDGIHFTNPQPIIPDGSKKLWNNISLYRSTFFVKDNKLQIYISVIIPHLNWYITKTTRPLP